MFGAGAVPVRRPDQEDWPSEGQGLGAGFRGNVFRGRAVIIFGTPPSSGLFDYTPSPGAGNLIASIVAVGAVTDPYTNLLLAGITSYDNFNFIAASLNAGNLALFTAPSEAGPWTQAAIIGLSGNSLTLNVTAGDLLLGPASGHTVFLNNSNAGGLLLQVINTTGGATNEAVRFTVQAAGDSWLSGRVAGDTNNRVLIGTTAGGLAFIRFGPGNAPVDATFQRLAANSLGTINADFAVDTVGRGLQVKEGTNAKQGTATLAAGTVTVANTSVTGSSRIFLGFTGTPSVNAGALFVSGITVGTGFTVKSTNAADTSTIAFQIFEPAP